jgi:outer membrane protein assembly factor BamB
VVSTEDNLVLVAGFDGRLRAVDIETQEQAWSRGAGNWFWATPLLENGVVYAASLDHKIYAVNASSGEDFWPDPYEADAEIRAAPVLVGDRLIVVDRDGHVHALDPQDGTRASETLDLGADVNADPLALSTGEVLFVTTGGEMIRVNPETMTLVSRVRLGS